MGQKFWKITCVYVVYFDFLTSHNPPDNLINICNYLFLFKGIYASIDSSEIILIIQIRYAS